MAIALPYSSRSMMTKILSKHNKNYYFYKLSLGLLEGQAILLIQWVYLRLLSLSDKTNCDTVFRMIDIIFLLVIESDVLSHVYQYVGSSGGITV